MASAMAGVQKWSSRPMTRMARIFAVRRNPGDSLRCGGMTRAGVLTTVALAAAALAPPARASFGPPAQLEAGSVGIGVAADTDAAGSTTRSSPATAAVRACSSVPRRRLVGGHAAAGRPQGRGRPRRRRRGARAPWGSRGASTSRATTAGSPSPCAIPADARPADPGRRPRGRGRAPSRARDRPGGGRGAGLQRRDACHAPQSRGGIAIAAATPAARSRADGRRSAPSSAPAVAIGPDGTGIVAWTHDHGVYAVSVSAGGRIGKVKRIASPSVRSARRGRRRDGAATLAWIGHHPAARGAPRSTATTSTPSAARRGTPSRRSARSPRAATTCARSASGRRGRPGDAGLGPGALRRRSFDRHQRRHERDPRRPRRRPGARSRRRGRSPRAAASTAPAGRGGRQRALAMSWGSMADRHDVASRRPSARRARSAPPQTLASKTLRRAASRPAAQVQRRWPPPAATVVYASDRASRRRRSFRLLAADGS